MALGGKEVVRGHLEDGADRPISCGVKDMPLEPRRLEDWHWRAIAVMREGKPETGWMREGLWIVVS